MVFFVCFNHMLKYFGGCGQKQFYESNKVGYFSTKNIFIKFKTLKASNSRHKINF